MKKQAQEQIDGSMVVGVIGALLATAVALDIVIGVGKGVVSVLTTTPESTPSQNWHNESKVTYNQWGCRVSGAMQPDCPQERGVFPRYDIEGYSTCVSYGGSLNRGGEACWMTDEDYNAWKHGGEDKITRNTRKK